MDGVKACCEYLKRFATNGEEARAAELLFDLAPQEGKAVEVEGVGLIDVSISEYVKELNARGYYTLACCSGLVREHKNAQKAGYISFAQSDRTMAMLRTVCTETGLEYEEDECYLTPSLTVRITGDEDEKEAIWERFFACFKRYIEKP